MPNLMKRMRSDQKKFLNLIFLGFFFTITLFINFLHTETTITKKDNCPACQFQTSALSTCQIAFFHLPPPPISGFVDSASIFEYICLFTVENSSRSPPEI